MKFLLLGLALVVVIAVAVAAIALRSLDLRRVAELVGERVKAASGREFAIKGPLGVRLFPSLAIAAGDVHIGNAPWGSRPDMLRLRRAEAEIAFWPLLRGRIEIRRFILVGPDLLLETDQAGTGNWILQPPGEKPADDSSGGAPAIGLDQLRVEDARIAYRDGKTGRETRVDVQQLSLDGAGDATRIAGALSVSGQRLRVEATTSRLEALAAGAAEVPIDLVVTVDGATATVKGTVSRAGQLDVMVTGDVTTTTSLSRLADTNLNVPLPLKASARVRGGGDAYVLDPLDLTVAGQAIGGRVAIKLAAARPAFDVSMASPSLDLTRLVPRADAKQQPAPPPSSRRWLFGEDPLPVDGLGMIDARLEARIGRLVLPNALPLQAVHLVLVARNRKLEVAPLAFTLARGEVTGMVALDPTGSGAPGLKAKIDGAGIRLEELAAATGRTGQISGGETSVAVDLTGTGGSLRRLAATASGTVRIVVGPAHLAANALDVGGDTLTKLLDIVNPFRKSDTTTELRCAVVRLPLRDGLVKIERSVAYETSKINVVMAGLVDLREETLDLAIRPSVTQGLRIGVANLAELVRVTGPLMEPRIGLDTMGAARQAVSVGAAVATGGLSLLGEAALRGAIDPHPCQSALAAGTPASPGASKPDKSEPVKGFIRGLLK
ncbi:MAG TPA: AsmA family protein [Methylomirabilota bacterium]|nr:AsmA family protein [Methylomirabilota bacterium]